MQLRVENVTELCNELKYFHWLIKQTCRKGTFHHCSQQRHTISVLVQYIGLTLSIMRHSLQFALNRALFKIFGALTKDTYKDICKYFGIRLMDEQISARQSKFYLRYCAAESAACHAISKLR